VLNAIHYKNIALYLCHYIFTDETPIILTAFAVLHSGECANSYGLRH
jgi:hypothetical protein